MSADWHIAQINIANALYPHDDPRMSRFFEQLDEINALADNRPGFVWRLQSETGNATDIQVGDDPLLIVNMSVWTSVDALFDFAYQSAHRTVIAERRQWFKRPDLAYQALWWLPAGYEPSIEDGMERLLRLQKSGPCPEAFSFKKRFTPPATNGAAPDKSS